LKLGGLNLVCLKSMCDSLHVSQFLRLLKSSDVKSLSHVGFWIGDSMCELQSSLCSTACPVRIPDYYANIEALIVEAKVDGLITVNGLKCLTNKQIYHHHTSSLPVCKIEQESGVSYQRIWSLINLPILRSEERQVSYLLVHNKLPIQERLFRIGLRNDPYCQLCDVASICDTEHYFTSCTRVVSVWQCIREGLINMVGDFTDRELLNFMWSSSAQDKEAVWLLGSFIARVWFDDSLHPIKREEMFGYLKFKFKADQLGSRHQMNDIPSLHMVI